MGTVAGDPDLSAVRRYEELIPPFPGGPVLGRTLDRRSSARILAELRERYSGDFAFAGFQGPTATPEDLRRSRASHRVWFGSHLYHHWDLRSITADLYEDSLRENLAALEDYGNALPVFATPYGFPGAINRDIVALPRRLGHRVVFTATGIQNQKPDAHVLDRVSLPRWTGTWRDWWYATHRDRLLNAFQFARSALAPAGTAT
jgi:hypothetical protein